MSSGIYKIVNLVNDKCYIGSAKNLETRKEAHFKKLSRGVHPNPHLQAAFSKYGKECFSFTTIKLCPVNELIKIEQCYIDQHDRGKLYNIRMVATSNLGLKASEETRRKMSESAKARGFTEEHKQNISKAQIGRISPMRGRSHSEETKRKIRESNAGQKRSAETRQKISDALKIQKPHRVKKVKCCETGEVFNSGTDAAKALGIKVATFWACIYNNRLVKQQYKFEVLQ